MSHDKHQWSQVRIFVPAGTVPQIDIGRMRVENGVITIACTNGETSIGLDEWTTEDSADGMVLRKNDAKYMIGFPAFVNSKESKE